jgi:hypothetical protein
VWCRLVNLYFLENAGGEKNCTSVTSQETAVYSLSLAHILRLTYYSTLEMHILQFVGVLCYSPDHCGFDLDALGILSVGPKF